MKIVVELFEYERGWGSRHFHSKEFPFNEQGMMDARKYRDEYNNRQRARTFGDVPDQYFKAHDPKIVDY